MFCFKYKKKNPSHVLKWLICCVCESLVRFRGICLHTYLGLSRSRIDVESLVIASVVVSKNLKKTQVRVFVVAVDQGKK